MPVSSKSADTDSDPLFISAVARAMHVLRSVADSPAPVTVSEIARNTGFTQSNVWRICYTMQKLGYLAADKDGLFRPGLPLLGLGHAALAADRLDSLASPLMSELADRFNGVSGVAIREGLSMLYLNRWEDVKAMLVMKLHPGSLVPVITSAMGWAHLAALDKDEREKLLKQVKAEQPAVYAAAKPAFDAEFARYEDQQFMLNISVFYRGVGFAGVSLKHPKTGMHYSLNCGGLSSALTEDVLRREVGPELCDIAGQLQRALGAVS